MYEGVQWWSGFLSLARGGLCLIRSISLAEPLRGNRDNMALCACVLIIESCCVLKIAIAASTIFISLSDSPSPACHGRHRHIYNEYTAIYITITT